MGFFLIKGKIYRQLRGKGGLAVTDLVLLKRTKIKAFLFNFYMLTVCR